jgi:hypothetical protein
MRSASEHPPQAARGCCLRAALAALVLCASGAGAARADDIYVVCHPDVALKPTEVKDVFLGEKGFAGSVKLAPADNSAAQAAFLVAVLKLDAGKYASIWTKKSFRDGANPPPVKASDAEALAYARLTPGGCSYASSIPSPGVNVIGKF